MKFKAKRITAMLLVVMMFFSGNAGNTLTVLAAEPDGETSQVAGEEIATGDAVKDWGLENDESSLVEETSEEIVTETTEVTEELPLPVKEEKVTEDPFNYDVDLDIDLSSKRLIVRASEDLLKTEPVIADLNGLFLIQYESVEEAKKGYIRLRDKAERIEVDKVVSISDGNHEGDSSEMTEDDNPFDEAKEKGSSSGYDIALIDTGAPSDSVSMVGDDGADRNGHGSKMKEIILANAPGARVLSIKAINDNGTGDISSVYAAIQYAIDSNVSIINLSFSSVIADDSYVLNEIIGKALSCGITVVGSAGNSGNDAGFYIPGSIGGCIIVGSCDETGHLKSFSNYGETVDYYITSDSTSEAAAHITGYIAAKGIPGENIKDKGIFKELVTGEGAEPEKEEKSLFIVNGYAATSVQDAVSSYGSRMRAAGNVGFIYPTSNQTGYYYNLDGSNSGYSNILCVVKNSRNTVVSGSDHYIIPVERAASITNKRLQQVIYWASVQYPNYQNGSSSDFENFENCLRYYFKTYYSDANYYGNATWTSDTYSPVNGNNIDFSSTVKNNVNTWINKAIPSNKKVSALYLKSIDTADDGKSYSSSWSDPNPSDTGYGDFQDYLVFKVETIPDGYLYLIKTSSNPSITNKNSCYDLKGTTYQIYNNENLSGNPVATLTVDSQGKSNAVKVLPGTYWFKETKAGKGYGLKTFNKVTDKITVTSNNTASNPAVIRTSDVPLNDPGNFRIFKVTADNNPIRITGDSAVFKVEYFSNNNWNGNPTRTWYYKTVDGRIYLNYEQFIDTSYSNSPFYRTSNNTITFPIGTVRITEIKAPAGYSVLGDSFKLDARITEVNGKAKFEWVSGPESNKLFYTADEANVINEELPAEIGTTLTSNGDKDIFASEDVTVEDKVKYKNLVPGKEYEIFGELHLVDPDGSDGGVIATNSKKFVPGNMTGSEIVSFTFNAAELKGRDIVAFETLKKENKTVAVHADITDEGQTVHVPEIGTTLSDSDGEKDIYPSGDVTLEDKVEYKNLIPGKEYELSGELHLINEDGSDGGILVANTKTFTPAEKSGSEVITFTFDAELLKGRDIVAFETVKRKDRTVAVHADITDEGQTVHVPEIGTTLTDQDGGKDLYGSGEQTVEDTVEYKNLIVGKEYELFGELHLVNEDGSDGGIIVTNSKKFIPAEKNGSEVISFTFDAAELKGRDIVAFETVKRKDRTVAVHADITDEGQTVHVPEIKTELLDTKTEDHYTSPGKENKVVDYVSYTNLIPGEDYELSGVFVVKADETETEITSTVRFTAEAKNGIVELPFTFEGVPEAGKTFVAYDTLKHVDTKTEELKTVATHADINCNEQTVKVRGIGYIKMSIHGKPLKEYRRTRERGPQTGDDSKVGFFFLTMALSLIAVGCCIMLKRKKKKKKLGKSILSIILISLFIGAPGFTVKADDGKDKEIKREYYFTTEDTSKLDCNADKEIIVDGVKYELKDIDYEIISDTNEQPRVVEKEVNLSDPNDFEKEFTENEIRYVAEEPKWEIIEKTNEIKKDNPPIIVQEYPAEETIPSSIKDTDGKEYSLSRKEDKVSDDEELVDIEFYNEDPGSDLYLINNRIVEIKYSSFWEGWQDDVRQYLDLSDDDEIVATKGFESNSSDGSTFTLQVTVKRKMRYVTAYYEYNDDADTELITEKVYHAKVKYTEVIEKEKPVQVKAVVTYIPLMNEKPEESTLSTAQKIMIGVGIAVLAAAIATAIYYMSKKKDKKEQN